MSAFIITSETMHRVIAAIDKTHGRDGIFGAGFASGEPGYLVRSCDDLEVLGNALFALNCDAVNQRYGNTEDCPRYTYRPIVPPRPIEQYAALACLLYQCSEGDVPERPLYKALTNLKNAIACGIAGEQMRGEHVPWDWPPQ